MLLVNGDLTGDGIITISDVSKLRKHYLGIELIDNLYLSVADLDGNSVISLTDIATMKKIVLGIIEA